jgi:hypothetical protein
LKKLAKGVSHSNNNKGFFSDRDWLLAGISCWPERSTGGICRESCTQGHHNGMNKKGALKKETDDGNLRKKRLVTFLQHLREFALI